MSAGTIIGIIVLIVLVAVSAILYDTHRRRLRRRFGPEYDRLVSKHGRRKAEAELAARQQRVRGLRIRALDPAAQARYEREWAAVQEGFVDSPQGAVAAARHLVLTLMSERGYPTEQGDQVLADLSVHHASVLDDYRSASEISERAAGGAASTEETRQAVIGYRALFRELLGKTPEPEASRPVAVLPAGAPPDGKPLAGPVLADSQMQPGPAREAG
jgi:hypothetical protein